MLNAPDASSTRPYLLRALHEWCTDSGFTPYVAVLVDETVQVPMEYVKNGEIVLNVGYDATAGMTLGNEFIEFKARFGGVPREIIIPINRVMAIYARENGQGMSFPMNTASDAVPAAVAKRPALSAVDTSQVDGGADDEPPTPTTPSGRPTLTRVK
ncbi:ClpXP protease specificity-enhancing factor [Limnohabitans sp. INBF002]|jgi:stringent starvation protein B|uniref:ClpXP protease specificity-enhancing factor n=1 Tax=Limnohabitans sp. INBF002 TaxID=2986280 RepID=UPI002377C877|nr:ClpXP protease specificity-enhancing factor [Limnohabitans sp. INBF002]BDU53973.1 stringent starvation protein B [Limnohabitans sp. INBF002]